MKRFYILNSVNCYLYFLMHTIPVTHTITITTTATETRDTNHKAEMITCFRLYQQPTISV